MMSEESRYPLEEPAEEPLEASSQDPDGQEAELVEALTQEELQALQTELGECQAKMNEYLDGWQRARAEFANYKKRIEREQTQVYQNAAGNIIKRYLDVADDLDRALKNSPAEGEGAEWAAGIDLIYRKLLAILESEGVTVIEAEGQAFDPNFHEAISHEDSPGVPSGQIIEVVKQGYLLGERVLRPAGVRVAK